MLQPHPTPVWCPKGTHQCPGSPHGALEPTAALPQAAPAAAVGGSGHRFAGVEPHGGSAGQGLRWGGAVEPAPGSGNGKVVKPEPEAIAMTV